MPEGFVGTLKIDLQGNLEEDDLAFDFVNSLVVGDSIASSPAPQIGQVTETSGAADLIFGAPAISGTQVVVRVTGTTGTPQPGDVHSLSCTIMTTLGKRRVCSGGIKLKASR